MAMIGATFLLWSGRAGLSAGRAPAPVVRFTITPPVGYTVPESIEPLAVSPSGNRIVFVAQAEGKPFLCVREVASAQARPLRGTEGCRLPFFSPDGKWLACVSNSRLMKMPADGGPALTLCDVPTNTFAFEWLEDGTIVYSPVAVGLWRVSAGGGTPSMLARSGPDVKTADGSIAVLGFGSIMAIPGARSMLATCWDGGTTESNHIVTVSLADGTTSVVLRSAAEPRLIAPDRLLFLRGSTVMTVGFDPARGAIVGEPVVALQQVRTNQWGGQTYSAASRSGAFAYVPGGRSGAGRRLIRVDETGKPARLLDGADAFRTAPIVSPDGRRAVVSTLRSRIELWVLDFERLSMSLLTSQGENYSTVWSADAESIYSFLFMPNKPSAVVRWGVGGGEPQFLTGTSAVRVYPQQALPDGSGLLVLTRDESVANSDDIAMYRFADASLTSVRNRPANESFCRCSPDGKWIAYTSDESGRIEVYLGPLGVGGPNVQVSSNGGTQPRISRDGKRVFFIDDQWALMGATVDSTGPGLRVTTPVKLFDFKSVGAPLEGGAYDVMPDGDFVMVEPAAWEKEPPVIHVILNWAEELRAKGAGK